MTGPGASPPTPPPRDAVDDVLRRALAEDLGTAGDLTTESVLAADAAAGGNIVARQDGTVAGLHAAVGVFGLLDGEVTVTTTAADGDAVTAGTTLARLEGSARAILIGERTCLNLLGHLSGIATGTAELVAAVRGHDVRVCDTRKTTPGLRALEKYAVRCGGASNHRFGLHDAVLLKDNHLAAAGSIGAAVRAVRSRVGHLVVVELEVERLEQIPEALAAGVDVVLLDNMSPQLMREAVTMIDGRAATEASGGITLTTIRDVAASGVDVISAGWITHSVPWMDVALDLDSARP